MPSLTEQENETESASEHQSKLRKGKRRTIWQRWQATSLPNKMSILLAAFVASLTYLQYRVMENQWKLMEADSIQSNKLIEAQERVANAMEESLKQTVKAMEQNSTQSRKALDTTIQNARLDQRAWVGMKEYSIRPEIKEGTASSFGIILTNSRKTPAVNIRVTNSIKIVNSKDTFEPIHRNVVPGVTSAGTLQPGATARAYTPPLPMTKPRIDGIKNGSLMVYHFGEIEYEDIFGSHHRTTFCQFLLPNLSDMGTCETYNDAT